MRFLLYLNLGAIVWLAGALVQLYEGTPLPWIDSAAGETAAIVETETPPGSSLAPEPVRPAAPLSLEQIMALQLPLPNPERIAEPLSAAPGQSERSATRRRLVFLTEGDYPPFNYRENDGDLAGFDVELARALCNRLQAECEFTLRPWHDLVPALKRGEGDAVIASMLIPVPGRESPAADEDVVFTTSYYSTPGHFAARRNSVLPAATASALAGRRIAVQAGSVHQAFALTRFPNATLVPFGSVEQARQALAEGEVDLVFADRNALLRWTSGEGNDCCRLVGPNYAAPSFFGEGAGIALRAEDEALRARMNDALSALVADGTYARISARYFSASIY
jgi:polar amino acid transport system substrate-binding protein